MLMMLSRLGKKLMIKQYIIDGGWSPFAEQKESMWWWIRLTSHFNQSGLLTHLLEVGKWKWK